MRLVKLQSFNKTSGKLELQKQFIICNIVGARACELRA